MQWGVVPMRQWTQWPMCQIHANTWKEQHGTPLPPLEKQNIFSSSDHEARQQQ